MAGLRTKPAAIAELTRLGLKPRLLRLELAAAYVGLCASVFLREVAAGRYPQPIRQGRTRGWDVRALDAALDRRSGLAASSPRDESPEAIMQAIDAAE